jgi:hypothetical protein
MLTPILIMLRSPVGVPSCPILDWGAAGPARLRAGATPARADTAATLIAVSRRKVRRDT